MTHFRESAKSDHFFTVFAEKSEKAEIFRRFSNLSVFRDLKYKCNAKRGAFPDVHKKFTKGDGKTKPVT